jgi:peroxiredoxin
MRSVIPTLFMCLLALAPVSCGSRSDARPEDVTVGNTVPDFSLKTLDGTTVSKSSLQGDVVVLNFWATWCASCMSEIPDLKEVAANSKVRVVGIALDEGGSEAVKLFVAAHGINYTVLLGDQEIFQQFNGVGIPYTIVLDRSQHIVRIYRGPTTREALEQVLKTIDSST